VIGQGVSREERQQLVSLIRKKLPNVAVIGLLGYSDEPFKEADFNISDDNPVLWERTVIHAA